MKINSPKDTKQLAEAKEEAYKEGFYKGKMIYGEVRQPFQIRARRTRIDKPSSQERQYRKQKSWFDNRC
jgi:hypothetical protein